VFLLCQCFCHDVRDHIVRRAIDQLDPPLLDVLAYKMEFDVNVFGMSMIFWVLRECNCSLIVRKQDFWCILWQLEVLHEFLEPQQLLGGLRNCIVLAFG